MNNIGYLLNNDCSLPRVNFISKFYYPDQNISQPIYIKLNDTALIPKEFDIGLNGKAIVVRQELIKFDIDIPEYVFSFFMYYCGDLSQMHTRTFSLNNCSVGISSNFNFAVYMDESSMPKNLTLSATILDLKKYSKVTTGRLSRNLHHVNIDNKIIYESLLYISPDNRHVFLILNGLMKTTSHNRFCEVHIFECVLFPEDFIDLHKKNCMNITEIDNLFTEMTDFSFNIKGDKVFLRSSTSYLVLSVELNVVLASGVLNSTEKLYWSHDIVHGEFLVQVDLIEYAIKIYIIDFQEKILTLSNSFSISSYKNKFVGNFHEPVVRVSSGISHVFIALYHVCVFDPFSGDLQQELINDKTGTFVCEIKTNWPSVEVLVFYKCSSSTYEKEDDYILKVFHLQYPVQSLMFLAARTVLNNLPVNTLRKIVLPKPVKQYLNL